METLKQCEKRVWQLQERIAELERENERLQAENIQLQEENKTLRASEARYRKCFENSPLSMVFVASDGRPVQANQAFERLYGMPLEQLKERNFNVFYDPQLVENGSLSYMKRAFAGETVIEPPTYYDAAKTVPGGRFSWNQALYFPIRDEAGVVQEIVEACLDLTDLYDTQQALLQEQERAAQERYSELTKANDALKRTISKLAEEPQLDAFLCNVMTAAAEQVGACSSALFVYDENTHTLSMKAFVDDGQPVDIATDPRMEIWRLPVPADITPAWDLFFRKGGYVIHEMDESNPIAWPQSIGWHRMMGNVSVLCLPLVVGGRSVGFIGFDFKQRADVAFEKVELARALTHQAMLALELTRLADQARKSAVEAAIATEQEKAASERAAELTKANESLQQRDRLLSVVAQITKDMLEAEDADAAIPVALRAVGEVANISRVLLILERLDPSTQRLKHCVAYEWVAAGITDHHSVGMSVMDNEDFQVLIQSLCKGQSVWRVMDDLPDVTRVRFETLEIKSTGAVPIFIEGRYIGCVGFDDCVVPRHWSQQEIDVLTAAADSIGAALHRKQLVERLIEERARAAEERAAELAEINAALSASEARLRTLFEQLPVSLQIFSDSGVCLEVNRAWEELWQLPSWAVVGKSTLVTPSSPSSILPSPFTPYLQRCFAGEPVVVPPLLFDPVATFQAGRARWVQTYIYPIKDQADVLREVLLIHQDIHALKQASEVARGQTEALTKVLSALVTEPDIDQLLAKVMITSTAQLNARASTLWLCDVETGSNVLHLVCCGDQVSRELPVGMREDSDSLCLLLDEQTWQQMERNRSPLILTDIATHPAVEHLRPWLIQEKVLALMLVPLLLGNQLIGSVGIHNTTRNYFRPEEMQLAQALAYQITLALQLTKLAQQARQTAILEERNRLAGEIHDTLAQTFTGISIQVDVIKRIATQDPEEAYRILDRVSELAQVGLTEARRSVWALYSPTTKDADLAQSLLHSVEQMTSDTSIQVSVSVQGIPCSLSMYVSQNLLRIGQEALTNILKHANAGAIWIELVYESEYVCLSVRDNGRGFVLSAATNSLGAGFGLIGMYQRAERIGGQLSITTQPGQGTEIVVRVPVR